MAKPIQPTPTLKGSASKRFNELLRADESKLYTLERRAKISTLVNKIISIMEEDNKPKIQSSEFKLTFEQENDCVEDSDEGQFLSIRTENGGGGDFFILETDRWAFNNLEELTEVFNQFKSQYDKL